METFTLKDGDEYYLSLSDQPKRFDADSPVTNVFFDDTNGQVFTVRSGGVTGVTVTGMDESKSTTFRMEDHGTIISIKFSPDHNILAIQRNLDNPSATVEFINFKDLAPTNVEYFHTCKWKNAKILGFVWPKVNEIAFITDHGIELLQVIPEKKQLKSLKSTAFSGAWFLWCAASGVALVAGNNGALLQPFALNHSTLSKLHSLHLENSRPVVERDVFLIRACDATWCAVFRHAAATAPQAPTELWLLPVCGGGGVTHILRTGLAGRFAISVLDDLIIVHHQSSQSSQVFDIMEESRVDGGTATHTPIVPGTSIKPATVDDVDCPMYSVNWVVFQPHFVVDARLGCLWRLRLSPSGLAFNVPKEDISKVVGVLMRRTEGKETVFRIVEQMVTEAHLYLVELGKVFDEINAVDRRYAELEAGRGAGTLPRVRVPQHELCARVLQPHAEDKYAVQVMTCYLSSLCRWSLPAAACTSEAGVRALVVGRAGGRLRALLRRRALHDARPLACALLSLRREQRAADQLALDMMTRLNAHEEIVEVLLSWNDPVSALGAWRAAGGGSALAPRKLLAAARARGLRAFVAAYHALRARNERTRGSPHFLKGEQCDVYVEYYKQITAEE